MLFRLSNSEMMEIFCPESDSKGQLVKFSGLLSTLGKEDYSDSLHNMPEGLKIWTYKILRLFLCAFIKLLICV